MYTLGISTSLETTQWITVPPRKKLIIELDGGQHLEQEEYDERREYFEALDYRVLRF
jgi:very-short-patch-repair endonuclease